MTKVLILGGCGYTGSALFTHLIEQGHHVHTYDLELRGNFINRGVNAREDFSDASAWVLSFYDVVILLAGYSTVPQCVDDPIGAFLDNVVKPANLLNRLKPDQTFIYASSASVYSTSMFTMYDATKRSFDDMVQHLRPASIGLRLGTVCGPSPNIRPTMINGMVESAVKDGVVRMSNPSARRPILGIHDFCKAIDLLIAEPQPGIFNLSSFNTTVRQAAEMVAATLNARIEEGSDTPCYDFVMDQELRVAFRPKETIHTIIEDLRGHYGKC